MRKKTFGSARRQAPLKGKATIARRGPPATAAQDRQLTRAMMKNPQFRKQRRQAMQIRRKNAMQQPANFEPERPMFDQQGQPTAMQGRSTAMQGRPIRPEQGIRGIDLTRMKKFAPQNRINPQQLALQGRLFSEGGEVNMKTPIDELPNEGLQKLAKSKKGREAVAKMGFKEGGIAKGGKCPHRGNVRGTGAAVRGVKFVGTR